MNSLPTFYLSNSWYLSFSVLGGHLQESQCFLLPAIAGRLSLLASFVAYTSMIYLSRVSDYLFLLGFVSPSLLVSWCNSTFWCNSIGQQGKTPSRLGRSHLCNRIFLSSRDNSPNAQVCPFHGRSSRLSFDCFIDFLAHYWLLFISVVHRHFHSGHYSAQVFLTKNFLLVDYWVGLDILLLSLRRIYAWYPPIISPSTLLLLLPPSGECSLAWQVLSLPAGVIPFLPITYLIWILFGSLDLCHVCPLSAWSILLSSLRLLLSVPCFTVRRKRFDVLELAGIGSLQSFLR